MFYAIGPRDIVPLVAHPVPRILMPDVLVGGYSSLRMFATETGVFRSSFFTGMVPASLVFAMIYLKK